MFSFKKITLCLFVCIIITGVIVDCIFAAGVCPKSGQIEQELSGQKDCKNKSEFIGISCVDEYFHYSFLDALRQYRLAGFLMADNNPLRCPALVLTRLLIHSPPVK
ncbi:MAG: hypothetical protein ABII88_04960 [Candidatus Omnitrophota bacterium]